MPINIDSGCQLKIHYEEMFASFTVDIKFRTEPDHSRKTQLEYFYVRGEKNRPLYVASYPTTIEHKLLTCTHNDMIWLVGISCPFSVYLSLR